MATIKCIKARQIFDSRGNPTVEVIILFPDVSLFRSPIRSLGFIGFCIRSCDRQWVSGFRSEDIFLIEFRGCLVVGSDDFCFFVNRKDLGFGSSFFCFLSYCSTK